MHHSLAFLHNRRYHQGELDPKRWPLSIVSVPSWLLKGPPQNCAIARNWSVHADFVITQRSTLSLFLERHWPSEAFLCPRGQSSRPSLCVPSSFLRLDQWLKSFPRFFFVSTNGSKAPLVFSSSRPMAQKWLIIFFFFFFFFFSIVNRRPQDMGMRASSQKRVQKRVQRARAESNWMPEGRWQASQKSEKIYYFRTTAIHN